MKSVILAGALVMAAANVPAAGAESTYFFRWGASGLSPSGTTAPANCALPWGATLSNGQSAAAYEADHVSFGDSCNSETRICDNGTLSGSFQHQSCITDLASNCTTPWGAPVAHAADVTAFQTATVPFASTCSSEQRVCLNGSLSGTFGFQTCSVDAAANCTTPWGASVIHGETTTAYQTASVPAGSSCASESRTCSNGTLSGSYGFQSCTPDPANCTTPWGATVLHGETTTGYQTASVPFGSTCSSETRSCNDGVLSGSFGFQTCAPLAAANCTAPWGATVLHDANTTAYQTASVPFGSTCSSQIRSCSDGTLSGSFTFQSCTVAAAANCTAPWGATVLNGNPVTAYQTASVPFGSTCTSEVRTCSNGTLSGGFANQTCAPQAPASCPTQTVSWNTNCSGTISAAAHGTASSAGNSAGGYTGTGNFSCSNGTWQNTGGSCQPNVLTCDVVNGRQHSGGSIVGTPINGGANKTLAQCAAYCISQGAQAGDVCEGGGSTAAGPLSSCKLFRGGTWVGVAFPAGLLYWSSGSCHF